MSSNNKNSNWNNGKKKWSGNQPWYKKKNWSKNKSNNTESKETNNSNSNSSGNYNKRPNFNKNYEAASKQFKKAETNDSLSDYDDESSNILIFDSTSKFLYSILYLASTILSYFFYNSKT
jgi:hypothetical protein